MPRIASLDLIKLLATIMVVALHLNVSWAWNADCTRINVVPPMCGIAIPLFFMVSGFLMAGKDVTIRYSVKKVFNILKLTLLVCLLYDIYIFIRSGNIVFDFPACLIQKGDWWHFWYFGTMCVIYLTLPFVCKYLDRKKLRITLFGLSVICVGFWLSDIFYLFEKKYIIQTFRLWYFFFYFLVGFYCRRNSVLYRPHLPVILLLMLAFVLSVLMIPAGGNEFHFGSPLCMGYAVSVFLFFLNSSYKLTFVSKLTSAILPTYLFHVFIINRLTMDVIHPLLVEFHIPGGFLFLIELVVTVCSCFIFSIVLMRVPKADLIFKL